MPPNALVLKFPIERRLAWARKHGTNAVYAIGRQQAKDAGNEARMAISWARWAYEPETFKDGQQEAQRAS